MIRKEPYKNVNWAGIKIPSISHEHNYLQERLESSWNRGIRHLPSLHYQPSVARYPLFNWNRDYEDWDSEAATDKLTCNNIGGFNDFIDIQGNTIHISDIPSLPNAEHVNMVDFGIHITSLGSTFSDVGVNFNGCFTPEPSQGWRDWRYANPMYTLQEMTTNILANKQYDKVFGCLAHPTYSEATYLNAYNTAPELFKGMEGWNNYYDEATNQLFRNKYDWMLKKGIDLFIVAVVDWQGDPNNHYNGNDYGCNVVLVDDNYDSMSKIEKEEHILDCYCNGKFYASGINSFTISSFDVYQNLVHIEFDVQCDSINIITNENTKIIQNVNKASIPISDSVNYVRFEAYKGNDFLFTQPVFYKHDANRILNLTLF